jgi:hypothetical protein
MRARPGRLREDAISARPTRRWRGRARPAPTARQEVRRYLRGRRAAGIVGAEEPRRKIARLEADDGRGGQGGALEDARG